MAWKIVHNSEPDFREDCFTGMCPRFGKKATITIKSVGSVGIICISLLPWLLVLALGI